MTKNEFDSLGYPKPIRVTSDMLEDKTPRTLMYGYEGPYRDSLHIYLTDTGEIVKISYSASAASPGGYALQYSITEPTTPEIHASAQQWNPERCDFEFSKLILSFGVPIAFNKFGDCDQAPLLVLAYGTTGSLITAQFKTQANKP